MDDGIDNNPYSPTTTQTDSSPFQTTGTVAETLKQFARTGQIITFALANGMVVIGAVFIFLRAGSDQETSLDLFFLIGLGVLATNLVLAFLLPAMMRSNAISRFAIPTKSPRCVRRMCWETSMLDSGNNGSIGTKTRRSQDRCSNSYWPINPPTWSGKHY